MAERYIVKKNPGLDPGFFFVYPKNHLCSSP